MRRTTEGETNLYRLTLQSSGSSARQETAGAEKSLDVLLAPLGIEVVRCDRSTALVDLRIPIDLPAIDHAVRASGLAVIDLESVDSLGSADNTGSDDRFEPADPAGSANNFNAIDQRRPAGV